MSAGFFSVSLNWLETAVRNTMPYTNSFPNQSLVRRQSCSTEYSTEYSIEYSVSIDAGSEWISGGFSVAETWTTGNTYTCDGNPGDTVCVWANIAHTSYTVMGNYTSPCFVDTYPSELYTIQSPNVNNAGGGYYCVVGYCRNNGDEYWE